MTNRSLVRTFGLISASALLAFTFIGCKNSSTNAANTAAINNGTAPATGADADPADANLAPASNTQVLAASSSYTPQQQGESYPQQAPAPVVQGYNDQDQADEYAGEDAVDYTDQAPPPLPEYDQPPAPEPNYLWTPGYWAWGPGGYYWVPGVWCPPPYYGALWTPPYWAFYNGRYGFHRGYWGPYVGFYGGVDYGFGYIGIGYFGGYWNGNNFYYNRTVTNVGRVGYVYSRPVVYNHVTYNGRIRNTTSYNGGRGGINVRPRPAELAAARQTRTFALPEQQQVARAAAQNKQQFYSNNRGKPAEIAQARPVASARPIAATPPTVVREKQQASLTRENANRPGNPGQRPGTPATEPGRPATGNQPRPAPATRPAPGAEQRPGARPETRPAPATRPAPEARPESRPAPAPRPESRPAPAPRPEQSPRPAPQPQSRPAPAPRPEQSPRPAPAPRPESRPAPAPRPESRPAPAPRPESRPAPQQHQQSAPHQDNKNPR